MQIAFFLPLSYNLLFKLMFACFLFVLFLFLFIVLNLSYVEVSFFSYT